MSDRAAHYSFILFQLLYLHQMLINSWILLDMYPVSQSHVNKFPNENLLWHFGLYRFLLSNHVDKGNILSHVKRTWDLVLKRMYTTSIPLSSRNLMSVVHTWLALTFLRSPHNDHAVCYTFITFIARS